MAVNIRAPNVLNSFRSFLSNEAALFQYLDSAPVGLLDALSNDVGTYQNLIISNQQLRHQNFVLQANNQTLQAFQYENQRLRQLYGLASQSGQKPIFASIVPVQAQLQGQQVILNKGSLQGVTNGAMVIDAYGIMGRVIGVSSVSSRVLLLTDVGSNVPVIDQRSEKEALVKGTGDPETLALVNVPLMPHAIEVGDILLSSGRGHATLPNYALGQVTEIKDSQHISVRPFAHINSSQQVAILAVPQGRGAP
jgi:rod shape-determining protein MreC